MILRNFASSLKFLFKRRKMESLERGADMFKRSDLVRLIIPLIIEQILAATIGVADTFMVSSVGEAAMSGVSLVDTINILLLQVFAALATGGAIVVSQYLGKEDGENANIAAKQLVIVVTLLSLVLMAACLVWKVPLLDALFGSAEPEVMENARTYFAISAVSYPLIAIYNGCAALFRAQGNSKISMVAALIMNIVNISFNAAFIYGLKMGVAGAALGSLIARFTAAAFLFILTTHKQNRVHIENLRDLSPHPVMIRNILRIGVPNGVENGIFHVGKIMVQGLIATFGTVALAANAVGNSIMTMSQMPGAAISLAMVTVIGQCIGAREYKQAKHYMLALTGTAYVMNLALNLSIILLMRPIIGMFQVSAQTAALAWQLGLVCCIGNFTFWPASFALPNGLRAANDVKFTMIISIVSMWVFRVGFSYVLGLMFELGVLGVWCAMLVDWLFRAVVFFVRLMSGKWQNRQFI